jgi:hypothetical protein
VKSCWPIQRSASGKAGGGARLIFYGGDWRWATPGAYLTHNTITSASKSISSKISSQYLRKYIFTINYRSEENKDPYRHQMQFTHHLAAASIQYIVQILTT